VRVYVEEGCIRCVEMSGLASFIAVLLLCESSCSHSHSGKLYSLLDVLLKEHALPVDPWCLVLDLPRRACSFDHGGANCGPTNRRAQFFALPAALNPRGLVMVVWCGQESSLAQRLSWLFQFDGRLSHDSRWAG
jgi:hypothetical protein